MTYIAQVGEENAAWLTENVGPADGNPPVFDDLGHGVVRILNLDAAEALGPDRDGVVAFDDVNDCLVLSIEGTGYPVEFEPAGGWKPSTPLAPGWSSAARRRAGGTHPLGTPVGSGPGHTTYDDDFAGGGGHVQIWDKS